MENFTAKLHVSPDAQPCYYRPWPVPHSLCTKLEKQLQHLESLGIIEPVQFSDWGALIVPVIKANSELCVCGDYKLIVNQVAKLETYPIPRIFSPPWWVAKHLCSKLDLAQAYLQVELDQSAKKYLATEGYTLTTTYLLEWLQLLQFFSK